MSGQFVITGTDTDIGKTVFAGALTAALDGHYWKPVQAGLAEGTDSETVARLGGIDSSRILPERFRLQIPASPHFSAAEEGIAIGLDDLVLPEVDGPLIIEGAGGALVPVNPDLLFADIFAHWGLPVILVASTRLGTEQADSEQTISRMGDVRRLGRLPVIDHLSPATLTAAFDANFAVADFAP